MKKFKIGDRILMLKHADWKEDIPSTIAGPPSKPKLLNDGTYDIEYGIDFYGLHSDLTDGAYGKNIQYSGCTVYSRHLRYIDSDNSDCNSEIKKEHF